MSTATTRFQVLQYTLCEGWVNTWTIDDVPETFATFAEAQAELDAFLAEIADQIATGERDAENGYDLEEFRIEPITDGGL